MMKAFPAADIELKVDQHGLNGYGWLRITSKGDPMIINVSEAKTHLSKLIDKVCLGEKVVIAKNNLPLVELVIHKSKEKRTLGLLKGQIVIPDDFIKEDNEINEMFYGDGD
jgi:antitoxin (DNA-binding transcriptional repressor) of toxin-antitoxin stability system